VTVPNEPDDPTTAEADGPVGGGSPRGYTWVIGLVAVIAVIGVLSLLIGGLGGDQGVSSR
jgi:hypothetical protein